MSWWGKLVGGAFGFVLGGPLGAVLGAALGHQFDRGLKGLEHDTAGVRDQERIQAAFFTAAFSVMGHVAKADGRVSEREITKAEEVMRQMDLSAEQRKTAINLFNEGKRPGFPLDAVLDQFRRECHHRTTLLQMFLEIQIQAALADGHLDSAENRVLMRCAEHLGFSRARLQWLLGMVEGTARGARPGRHARPGAIALQDAYRILGVPTSASDDQVKRAYRRLMNQHHPDKLVAKGLPEEMLKLANEKAQQVRAAYDRIKDARVQGR